MRKFLAKLVAEFWRGFENARAESEARAQRAPLAVGQIFAGLTEEQIKAQLAAALRGSFDEGVAAEKARVEAILAAPEAALFTDLAGDLVRGPATSDQAIKVLVRAENDAAKRAALLKSSPLESANAPTIH